MAKKIKITDDLREVYTFKLSDEQILKYLEWYDKQMKKDNHLPTAGERFEFQFTPSGLGTIVWARDCELDEEIDLTEWKYF